MHILKLLNRKNKKARIQFYISLVIIAFSICFSFYQLFSVSQPLNEYTNELEKREIILTLKHGDSLNIKSNEKISYYYEEKCGMSSSGDLNLPEICGINNDVFEKMGITNIRNDVVYVSNELKKPTVEEIVSETGIELEVAYIDSKLFTKNDRAFVTEETYAELIKNSNSYTYGSCQNCKSYTIVVKSVDDVMNVYNELESSYNNKIDYLGADRTIMNGISNQYKSISYIFYVLIVLTVSLSFAFIISSWKFISLYFKRISKDIKYLDIVGYSKENQIKILKKLFNKISLNSIFLLMVVFVIFDLKYSVEYTEIIVQIFMGVVLVSMLYYYRQKLLKGMGN